MNQRPLLLKMVPALGHYNAVVLQRRGVNEDVRIYHKLALSVEHRMLQRLRSFSALLNQAVVSAISNGSCGMEQLPLAHDRRWQ
jgi:hypothetical protein